jgi:uncharacterized peroxidase-related enzyme
MRMTTPSSRPSPRFYNDLMLAPSGLSKLEREMIAVAVSSVNRCYYCLTAHGAGGAPALRRSGARRDDGDELPRRAALAAPSRHARLLGEADGRAASRSRRKIGQGLRQVGFGERDIWDIGAVAAFYNMSNRMASAVDMRPNAEYHGASR